MKDDRPIIHVVDDDPSFRASTGELLIAFGHRVALYESAASLLESPPTCERGCILLDLQMRGLNGLQLQNEFQTRQISLPIVFVTAYGDIPTSVHAIKAGAEDFLTKPVPKEKLFAAIERALDRRQHVRDDDGRNALLRALYLQLTPREHQIFDMLAHGKLNKQIAYALAMTERTVKFHRQNVMQKCRAESLSQLVLMAERLGLLRQADEPAGTE